LNGIPFSKKVSKYWNNPNPLTGFTTKTATFFAITKIFIYFVLQKYKREVLKTSRYENVRYLLSG
jgi:hypothetical protein